jgi:hypothetical protein
VLISVLLPLAHPRPDAPGLACTGKLIGCCNLLAVEEHLGRAVRGSVAVGLPVGGLLRALLLACVFGVTLLILAPVIVGRAVSDEAVCDPADEEPPEKVDGLETSEEGERDDLRERALVLLCFPVELEGTDGLEFGEDGVEDAQVDVVAEVAPDAHEDEKVGPGDGRVEVVEDF